ncbi:MAG: hypothetical protein H6739_26380 [Alphaproteobacteria bacterium]|nr:hypothetical protein [Alphaproteobacteria bacterium]
MRRTLLLLPLAVACGDKDASDDSTPPEAFAPAEGHWSVIAQTVPLDECGFFTPDAEDTAQEVYGFTLTLFNEATFYVLGDEEGAERLLCTLDDHDFSCESSARSDLIGGGQATLTVTESPAGTFVDERHVNVQVGLEATCEGSGCAAAEAQLGITFPCSARIENSSEVDG